MLSCWALACVAQQSKQILCKDRILFLGGVIFCGEGLWEKGRGSVFFVFFFFFFFFFFLSLFPFAFVFSYVCLYGLHCLIWLEWLALNFGVNGLSREGRCQR